jgi:hypothetical protein
LPILLLSFMLLSFLLSLLSFLLLSLLGGDALRKKA